ncbi:MAG TPA: hypothetical protein VKT70_02770 [Stellaceae bacterium]|nr:hypothetical protein [Stellaceae bacterium]
MIEAVAAAAKNPLSALGWELQQIDKAGRGYAHFADADGNQLTLEIGFWYPSGAHHLDDEPCLLLSCRGTDWGGTPKVLVPYQGKDKAPDLRWSATPDEITRATHAVIRDFERAFLAHIPDRRMLYNTLLDHWLKNHGILDEAQVNALRTAFAFDAATSVGWAEGKLTLLRERIRGGAPVQVFDPALKKRRTITTTDQFDVYVASVFPPAPHRGAAP